MQNLKQTLGKLSTRLGSGGKIGLSWTLIVAGGIYAFYLSKESIIAKRVQHMKVRERISASNTGEYAPSTRKYAN